MRLGISRVIISSRNLQIGTFPEKGGSFMAISYKKLWKLLIDKDMTKKALMQATGISKSTMDKMSRGENISLEVLDRICNYFECSISDIMEHVSSSDSNR